MTPDHNRYTGYLDKVENLSGIGAILLAFIVLLLKAVVHYPFFDETLHVHYLWLLANGYRPGVDFYCHYPSLAYQIMIPFFNLLPDSVYVVLVMRLVSLALYSGIGVLLYRHGQRVAGNGIVALLPLLLLAAAGNTGPFMAEFSIDPFAATAAVGALCLFFRPPDGRTLATAAGLALLSVVLTPKFVFPLFFGLIGYSAAHLLATRKIAATAAALCTGGAVALVLALLIYWVSGVSFTDNVTATLVSSNVVHKMTSIMSHSFVFRRLVNKPVFVILALAGIIGWAARSRNRLDHATLGGAGILLGTVTFFFSICLPLEQYQMAIYLALALFVPFAFTGAESRLWLQFLRCCAVIAVLVVVAGRIPKVLHEFTETSIYVRDADNPRTPKGPPGFRMLAELEIILRMIPKGETVVALWPHHPILRKDAAGVTWDERPSYSTALSPDNPNASFFTPLSYQTALNGHMPAFIDLDKLQVNYPPQWHELTIQHLARNGAYYEKVPSRLLPGNTMYLRHDLVKHE